MESEEEAAAGGGSLRGGEAAAGNAEPQLGRSSALNAGNPSNLGRIVSGWYSRGYLPHFDRSHMLQSVTFRLADSLPQAQLRALDWEYRHTAPERAAAERRRRIEQWLDSGMGCCALGHRAVAEVVQQTLLKWDGDRYRLLAWCVMPNHVHVLLETLWPLWKIVQSWKSFTGRWAMRHNAGLGLGIPGGCLWMREYWDRYIRDGEHLARVKRYIERNPVTAKLCEHPADWPWSSARSPMGPGTPSPSSADPER